MAEENDGQQQSEQAGSEFKPITSQEELNKLIGERIGKVKSQFADYDALREKASKFDEVQEQSKSELQKAIERAEAAERRASEHESAALRATVAAEKGVLASALTGATKEELEASADALIAWRDAAAQGAKKAPPPASKLSSGSAAQKGGESGRAAAALRSLRQG